MKNIKFSFLSFVVVLLLSSCSRNLHKQSVPNAIDNAVHLNAKKSKLTAEQLDHWQHFELAKDSIPGMNMTKAYEFLKGKKAESIVVAVIDSGMDVEHEDLKGNIWINSGEIANNGIDDDQNGFIDDINGWNFLGDKYDENLEMTRMVKMYAEEFNGKTLMDLKGDAQQKYKLFKELEEKVNKSYESGKSVYYDLSFHKSAQSLLDDEYNYNVKIYGNGTVMHAKSDEVHATHVAGIIGAVRSNGIGMDGVADQVKIMAIRVVPNGDEYDKDVALGIIYAVDNGAKVINMSFGKAYSPNAEWVGDAFKYAEKHDVLVLHSAGNSGNNIDIDHTYPNDAPDYKKPVSDNVLTIGALNPVYSDKLVASFSNYGKVSVDIFAPGVKILSSTPEGEYKHFSGTSMATPATAGVAALIRAYYPLLSASQVKHIIMNSGTKVNMDVKVPGQQQTLKPFSELCVSGRIVDAYSALVMAAKMMK